MSIYVSSWGQTQLRLQAQSPIMNPNGNHMIEFDIQAVPTRIRGLEIIVQMMLNGSQFPMEHRVWTPDQLADVYELAHHQLHGHDPRGLDPTTRPTRLVPPGLHRG